MILLFSKSFEKRPENHETITNSKQKRTGDLVSK